MVVYSGKSAGNTRTSLREIQRQRTFFQHHRTKDIEIQIRSLPNLRCAALCLQMPRNALPASSGEFSHSSRKKSPVAKHLLFFTSHETSPQSASADLLEHYWKVKKIATELTQKGVLSTDDK